VRYLLDTSAWLRGYAEPDTVPAGERKLMTSPGEVFGLSAISLWEIAKKHQQGKLALHSGLADWFKHAVGSNIQLLPLDAEVVVDAMNLPDFPVNDPADELIVATARVHRLTLLTTDTRLKGYHHARIHYFTPVLEGKRK
jgi:PIN domain nuclease of toxin-antitoxin system